MNHAKIGSLSTRQMMFLADQPPEKLPILGPQLPMLTQKHIYHPIQRSSIDIICPYHPSNPGPPHLTTHIQPVDDHISGMSNLPHYRFPQQYHLCWRRNLRQHQKTTFDVHIINGHFYPRHHKKTGNCTHASPSLRPECAVPSSQWSRL